MIKTVPRGMTDWGCNTLTNYPIIHIYTAVCKLVIIVSPLPWCSIQGYHSYGRAGPHEMPFESTKYWLLWRRSWRQRSQGSFASFRSIGCSHHHWPGLLPRFRLSFIQKLKIGWLTMNLVIVCRQTFTWWTIGYRPTSASTVLGAG